MDMKNFYSSLYPGKRVRVRVLAVRPENWNSQGEMDKWMGEVVTLKDSIYRASRDGGVGSVGSPYDVWTIEESNYSWHWRAKDFEPYEDLMEKFGNLDKELFEL